MAHNLRLLIGREEDFGETFRAPPFLGSVKMMDDIIATPLERAVVALLADAPTAPERLEIAAKRLSQSGPLVFLETQFFGGAGGKEAAVWIGGDRKLAGWDQDADLIWFPGAPEHEFIFEDAAVMAFGFPREETGDAFSMFDLQRWRSTNEITEELRAARGYVPPVGVILAGGLSSRMGGGDKGLLQLGDRPILQHVIDRLHGQVGQMALNANGNPARFAEFGLPVIADSVDGFAGPLAGVLAGLDWAASQGATHIVTVAADTPFFPQGGLVSSFVLATETTGKPIALARTENGRHPTFGLWPVALRDDLRRSLQDGVRKVVQWTDSHGTAIADFHDTRFDPFFNVNTPEDLKRAEQLLGYGA